MNDYGQPQNDKTQQDDQAHELIEQLNLLEDVDRRITPEHVAKRFRELLDDIGDGGPPSPTTDQQPRGILDHSAYGDQPTGPWRKYNAEPWMDPFGLTGSLEAAVAAARSVAADIIADAELKAKAASDELRRAQEAAAVARQEAEQFVADARAEADKALERAIKMIQDAGDQAKQILDDARNEAEQIVTVARNQQANQATWPGRRLKVYGDGPEGSEAFRLTLFLAAHGIQEPLGFSGGPLARAEQLASMATDDATSVYQEALYQTLTHVHRMDEAARAGRIALLCRNLNTQPSITYQDRWLASVGDVGSAARWRKLAAGHGDLDMLLARYGDLDECALTDPPRMWDLVRAAAPWVLTGHGDWVYAVSADGRTVTSGGENETVRARDLAAGRIEAYLDTLSARDLGHVGQDAPRRRGGFLPALRRAAWRGRHQQRAGRGS